MTLCQTRVGNIDYDIQFIIDIKYNIKTINNKFRILKLFCVL